MADRVSRKVRSRNMAAIRSWDTKPEMRLRRALFAAGIRGWRCHRRDIPGRPDLAFIRTRVAVFVDGAYWHGHPTCVRPDASPYWREKISRNKARDRSADAALGEAGWTVVRLWDFEVNGNLDDCVRRVSDAIKVATGQAPRG
jgi:DNA mismatch endonuclease (patch repair protein)